MFLGAKVRRFSLPHNTLCMLFAYHVYGILLFFHLTVVNCWLIVNALS